jgi:hypothetical protein
MARQSITNNDNGVSLLEKVLHNINELKTTLGVTIPSTAVPGSDDNGPVLIGKLNTVFSLLARGTSYTPLTGNENGPTFVTALNTVFTALYNAASGDPSVATVYDLSHTKGTGVSQKYFPVSVASGKTYYIRQDTVNASPPEDHYFVVKTYDADKSIVDKWLDTKKAADFGQPCVATGNASFIGISGYGSEKYCISVEHDEPLPSEQILGNAWFQKKWLLVGDSISTEDKGYATVGYGKLAADEFGLREYNIAVSGTTTANWLNKSGAVEVNLDNIRNDFDLVSIMLGTNDEAYSAGASTYASRCIALYDKIKARCPNAVYVFLTPIKRYNHPNLSNYVTALKNACSSHTTDGVSDPIPCIDLYNDTASYTAIDPGNTVDENMAQYFFVDKDPGTHPNNLGHATFLYPPVKAWLENNTPNE